MNFREVALEFAKEALNSGTAPVNGLGVSPDYIKVLQLLHQKVEELQAGKAHWFFVPDLWHITRGDVPMFSERRGQDIWDQSMELNKLAKAQFSHVQRVRLYGVACSLYSYQADYPLPPGFTTD